MRSGRLATSGMTTRSTAGSTTSLRENMADEIVLVQPLHDDDDRAVLPPAVSPARTLRSAPVPAAVLKDAQHRLS